MTNGYETPSEDESAGTVSPIEVENREAPGIVINVSQRSIVTVKAGSKRRMAPSGNSQREAKSRRTGEVGGMSAPGQGQGPRGPAGGSGGNSNMPPSYSELAAMGMGMDQRAIMMDDGYGPRHGPKREELADQKLMDDLKKDLGDPLTPMISQSQAQSANAARSPPPSTS